MKSVPQPLAGVFFDLDGTLVDSGWGYLGGADPQAWGPDAVSTDPHQLAALLGLK
jgi:phosphoglycolate phosphatase-like HAD superfamily hydrolase